MTPERDQQINAFLAEAGWGEATRAPLAEDASTRRYERITRGKERAVLMDAPPGAEEPACPPNADEATRRALGYNALARLAGPDPRPFVAVADFLAAQGLSAPRILHTDYEHGFLLIEDLGDDIYNRVINGGGDELPLYQVAIDAMVQLHQTPAPNTLALRGGSELPLLDYDAVALTEEAKLLTEWYLPIASGSTLDPAAEAKFINLWRAALDGLNHANEVVILRDYHADNLLWLPERMSLARVGMIDFQDGLRGHRAYDLVSLLEDARRDVDPALAARMLDRYVAGVKATTPDFDEDDFRLGYALLGLQRNTKILGIFARLWKRDGKPQYPSYMPRLWCYVEENLNHPAVTDLKYWYDTQIPKKWRGDHMAKLVEQEQ